MSTFPTLIPECGVRVLQFVLRYSAPPLVVGSSGEDFNVLFELGFSHFRLLNFQIPVADHFRHFVHSLCKF